MNIVFLGTGELGVPSLRALVESKKHQVSAVITQPDRPAGRSQKLLPSAIKTFALEQHLRIFQPEKIKSTGAVEQLRYLAPDVIVVASYGQILSREILDIPRKACLNVHASLLPRYRGASPIQSAIRDCEKETGVTIMWMAEGLDTGDVLLQEKLRIKSHDTAETLHDRLAEAAAPALLEALELVAKDKAPRTPQDGRLASYAGKLAKEDGKIDWSRSSAAIDCHIRAMTPWPSAFTMLPTAEGAETRALKIFSVLLAGQADGKPGEVLRSDSHGILVAAGQGGLLLREVQMEGKKRMSAADFARGYQLEPGAILS